MKKRIVFAGIAFFVCVISFLLIRSSMNTKTFDDFIGKPNQNISKITMMDGDTGKSVSTTDKAKIKELITLLKSRRYHKVSKQEGKVGFSYSYNFYVDNKAILGISDCGGEVSIYGTRYSATIVPNNGLETWYNSLVTASTVAQDFIN